MHDNDLVILFWHTKYEGYIVFVFRNNVHHSVCLCEYVCVFWGFFVKDFSGTTATRILKFFTNFRYDLLYSNFVHCIHL